ncbi:hypothetical protein B0J15DRAFT_468096 [Fusarium solani]|jgi:hypothetical protein|uniref:Uncharacterized protein n=2 Tax=Fusarium solani TaxID=169388 RepID=A0A9P9H399_FUSSL|nr:uncharacterized protein B0J15DRAFT_468096 [Fusarium solani]KAH7249563.1 hypothetical protein B0J15DRAFT_468096 [Fusarium solani]
MSDAEDRDPRRDSDEDEEETRLYQAIHLRRYTCKLVGYMLNSRSDPKCIGDTLEFPCGEGDSAKTCLTLAFENDLRVKALQTLVQYACDRALGGGTSRGGNTDCKRRSERKKVA